MNLQGKDAVVGCRGGMVSSDSPRRAWGFHWPLLPDASLRQSAVRLIADPTPGFSSSGSVFSNISIIFPGVFLFVLTLLVTSRDGKYRGLCSS